MESTFEDAVLFNSPGIVGWNVESLQFSSNMFSGASAFNQDISAWQVGQVLDMEDMFYQCTAFSQDLCSWGPLLAGEGNVTTGLRIFEETACPYKFPPNRMSIPPGPYSFTN
jgi:surface protein